MEELVPDTNALALAEQLFYEATTLHPDQYAEFVNRKCGSNAVLRQTLEQLLAAHDQNEADEFILKSPPSATGQHSLHAEIVANEGDIIGRYRLGAQLGEGGMGRVFAAEQIEGVKRSVALKIIKVGLETKRFIQRFAAEQQTLALLDHPNITRVLDAGATKTGRPYFVMDLVDGLDFGTYIKSNELSLEEKLELFVEVCDAVEHAHQKGIIHRDLKPTNILITEDNGRPKPKVIDFGISKVIDDHDLDNSKILSGNIAMLGTPLYMSPEQAGWSKQGIDTRSDIYSLGVILYELITGTTPISASDISNLNSLAIFETLRDSNVASPSSRISALNTQQPKGKDGSARNSPVPQVGKELDWITMKALASDRNRRYASVGDLSEDIRACLSGDPVSAAPPSRFYVLATTIRKYRRIALAACMTAMLLLAATIVCAILAINNYQKSKQLGDLNSELRTTIINLRNAESKIQNDADLTKYRSAIVVAIADYEEAFELNLRKRFPGTPRLVTTVENQSDSDAVTSNAIRNVDSTAPDNVTTGSSWALSTTYLTVLCELPYRDLLNEPLSRIRDVVGKYPKPIVSQDSDADGRLKLGRSIAIESRTPFYRAVVQEYGSAFGPGDRRVSQAHCLLAASLMHDGKFEEARTVLQKATNMPGETEQIMANELLSSLAKQVESDNQ